MVANQCNGIPLSTKQNESVAYAIAQKDGNRTLKERHQTQRVSIVI